MIIEKSFQGDSYELVPTKPEYSGSSNIVSCVVGKNGTGKSRLLRSIVIDFLAENPNVVESSKFQSNLISLSTSSFDRFPIFGSDRYGDKYSYLGIRDISSRNISVSYMSKIVNELIEFKPEQKVSSDRIGEVLSYLGFRPNFDVNFKIKYPKEFIETINCAENVVDVFFDELEIFSLKRGRQYLDQKTIDKLKCIPEGVLYAFIRVLCFLQERGVEGISSEASILLDPICLGDVRGFIEIEFDSNNQIDFINDGFEGDDFINDDFEEGDLISEDVRSWIYQSGVNTGNAFYDLLVCMMKVGFLSFKDMVFFRDGKEFKIKEASSGEQSILLSFLGIASSIKNGSVILIDEPEICLHPEWQEKYISLLINSFQNFEKCHFIIATHSPLIVSKLKSNDCFVMSMEDGFARPASEVNRRSVDFQLTEVFKNPGFKNEYLTRMLISALAQFSETGKLDLNTQSEIEPILRLKNTLDPEDPNKQLMDILEKSIGEFC